MGADHSKTPTELEQYLILLQQRNAAGQPFVIVGGHAVNFWAKFYLEREPKLKDLLPFTSKDLDLIGTKEEAAQVAKTLQWHVSPPVMGGGPVQAILSAAPGGAGLRVEFLSEIKGVSHETITDNAREGLIRIPQTGESVQIRVLDPVLLLAGKIRNAVDIEQNRPENPRQDVKHVAMLARCVPHFLEDLRAMVENEVQRRDVCLKQITILASLKNTYSGRQFEAQHPGVMGWAELVPASYRRLSFEKEMRDQLRELGVLTQPRGISI